MAKKNSRIRQKPTGIVRPQVAPHSKTLSNGKSRPKKRGK